MKQSTKVLRRQFPLWCERGEQIRPSEEMHEEVTRALADLLLEAMGVNVLANELGGDDESKDHD